MTRKSEEEASQNHQKSVYPTKNKRAGNKVMFVPTLKEKESFLSYKYETRSNQYT